MSILNREKLEQGYLDLETVKDVVNGPANLNGTGGVTSRLGTPLKTVAKILADITAATNNFISSATLQIAQAIANASSQVITGGAPILSSESAALLPTIPSNSVVDKQIVNLKGWYVANDGGDQVLMYSATSTATVNGGTVFPGPGGVLSFNPTTGAFTGSAGTGRYLALRTRRLTPEQFGAVGDATTDDSRAIQRCINYAVTTGNCTIVLNPKVSYGIGSTLIFPVGNMVEMCGSLGEITQGNPPTFVKLADILGMELLGDHYLRNFKLMGRGSVLPQDTPANTETKPGIVIRGRSRLSEVNLLRCGGLNEGTEVGTTAYAIGIVQKVGGNCNACDLDRIGLTGCNGGVYIGREPGAIRNVNAIRVTLDKFFQCLGIGINDNDGFRNHYEVRHAECQANMATAIFRFNYVENYAYCQYAEGTIPTGVIFGPTAGRNHVVFLDGSVFASIGQNITNDCIRNLEANQWYGAAQKGDLNGQYANAFDLGHGSTYGVVTWAVRSAIVSSFARLIHISLQLNGTKTVSSTQLATIKFDRTIFVYTPERTAAAIFPARLTNSAGAQIVYLHFIAIDQMRVYNAAGAVMTFDQLCGDGAFTLAAAISAQRQL